MNEVNEYYKEGSHLIKRVIKLPKYGSTTYLYTIIGKKMSTYYRWLPDKSWETIDLAEFLEGNTSIEEGDNITLTGTGTTTDPYIISAPNITPDGSETIIQGSGDIEVTGIGTSTNPYIVQYDANIPIPTLRFIKKVLTPTQVRNLGTTPIELVANPGIGKGVEVFTAFAQLAYIAPAFDGGGDLDVACLTADSNNSQYRLDPSFLLDSISKNIIMQRKVAGTSSQIVYNDSLVVRSSDSTIGGSTVTVQVTYRIVDM